MVDLEALKQSRLVSCLAFKVAGVNGGLLLGEQQLRGRDIINADGEAALPDEARAPLGQPPHHRRCRLS